MPSRRGRRRKDPVPSLFLTTLIAVAVLVAGMELLPLSLNRGLQEPAPTVEAPEGASDEASPSDEPGPEGQEAAPQDPEGLPSPGNRIRVEVLNGSGVPGLAAQVRDLLRDHGFDVVYFGNAPSFDEEVSSVVDRAGGGDGARGVAEVLGITEVTQASDPDLLLDVTVVLGRDWEEAVEDADLPAVEEAQPERPWWDLRRILPGSSR